MWHHVVWINHFKAYRIDILATFTHFKTHSWRWSSWGGGGGGGSHILVPKNTFTDVFDISCDIGDFDSEHTFSALR